MDSKKVIHSNNYLAFAVKKDSITTKLTEAIIDNYYDTLKNPLEKKYKKSKEASKIYQKFEEEHSVVNIELLEKCRSWIKQHIFSIDKLINIDLGKKNILKSSLKFLKQMKKIIRRIESYLFKKIIDIFFLTSIIVMIIM